MARKATSILLSLLLVLSLMIGLPSLSVKATETKGAETSTDSDLYELHYAWSEAPENWNPLTWETVSDQEMLWFISDQNIDYTIAEDSVNWTWQYDGVVKVRDVTGELEADKWGIEEGETMRAWEYELAPRQQWEDGTAINADSYVYSFQQLLDPLQKNRRAEMFIAGDSEIVGAEAYFHGDNTGKTRYSPVVWDDDRDNYTETAAGVYWVNLSEESYFFGGSPEEIYANELYTAYFSKDGVDLFQKYSKAWSKITDSVKEDLNWLAAQFGYAAEDAWREFAAYEDGVCPAADWNDVGILSDGEQKLTIIYAQPLDQFYAQNCCNSFPLVHEASYEAAKAEVGTDVLVDYGTRLDNTISYGPYKMTAYEPDKQIVFERNTNWHGYHDEAHKGQFQADRYVIDIVPEAAKRLELFETGKIDRLDLETEDFERFRYSDYLLQTDEESTFRWIFATSLESLSALEKAQATGNKRILHYKDFRQAISLAMDRKKFCAEATTAFKPAYFLLNNLYYLNISNDPNSQYRKSYAGMESVLRVYDVAYGHGSDFETIYEACDSIDGYDPKAAAKLFTAAYEAAVADGNYEDGQEIVLRCMVSSAADLSSDDIRQQDLMNRFVQEATEGTPLEDKIRFEFISGSKNRYDDVAAGKIEMIRGAWGGAAFYPYRSIGAYVDPDYVGGLSKIHESNGWNPTQEELTIVWDFNGDGEEETVSYSLTDWYKILNSSDHEWTRDNNTGNKNVILSQLESAVISSYQSIPWGTETTVSLRSMKLEYPTYDYNIMYGYGGDRLLRIKYTAAEWADFVKEQGGSLDYE